MKPARIAKNAFLAIILPVAALVFPVNTWAASGTSYTCMQNYSCFFSSVAKEIAIALWSYSNRTLLSFGGLFSDVTAAPTHASHTLTAFVDLLQTVPLWGLLTVSGLIITAAGLLFLALYLEIKGNTQPVALPAAAYAGERSSFSPLHRGIKLTIVVVVSALLGAGSVYKVTLTEPSLQPQLQSSVMAASVSQDAAETLVGVATQSHPLVELDVKKTAIIKDTFYGYLPVRVAPDGQEITKLAPGEEFPVLSENDFWIEINLDDATSTPGWVPKQSVRVEAL